MRINHPIPKRNAPITSQVIYFIVYISAAFLIFKLFKISNFLNLSDYLGYPSEKIKPPEPNITTYADYCVHGNVVTAKKTKYESIGQILHVSYDYLNEKLIEQVENWKAPLSVAIILNDPRQYQCAIDKLLSMRERSSAFREHLHAHIVFSSENCSLPDDRMSYDCKKVKIGDVHNIANYPANIGRNVARQFLQTRFILIADLEHLFSANFERDVYKLAEKYLTKNPKKLLIYHIFEVEKYTSPRNVKELKVLYDNKKAAVFHETTNYAGHYIPGLKDWFKGKEEKPGLAIWDIKYTRWGWEPQFVSVAEIPEHDLNFPFRVRDNTVLRWELCRAGYSMSVISKHFMFHKKTPQPSRKKMRKIQKMNYKKFENALKLFNIRMDSTYPKTKTQCPVFDA